MGVDRKTALRSKKFDGNITKKGLVNKKEEKPDGPKVGPVVMGFLLFVILGSTFFQIIQQMSFKL